MISRTASSARKEFSDTINRVIYLHERVILERHGKPVAVILPMEEYLHMEKDFAGQACPYKRTPDLVRPDN